MIARSLKFPLRTNFLSFRKRAKVHSTQHFLIYSLAATRTRCAVVVPKKVSKLATTRNWLKRLTYNTLYPLIKDKNLDCVMLFKPLPLKKTLNLNQEFAHELTHALNNL